MGPIITKFFFSGRIQVQCWILHQNSRKYNIHVIDTKYKIRRIKKVSKRSSHSELAIRLYKCKYKFESFFRVWEDADNLLWGVIYPAYATIQGNTIFPRKRFDMNPFPVA